MKFQTEAAQAAYEEHLRVAGEQIAAMRDQMTDLARAHAKDVLSIQMSAAQQGASMLLEAHAEAVRLGTHVDVRWADLKAHLMMCAKE